MNKSFLQAFPTLVLDDATRDTFKDVAIEKISATKKQDILRIYISSSLLIDKTAVYRVEDEIKKLLFSELPVTVKIYERFNLSSQYTPRFLFDFYHDSIFAELKNYDPIEYTLVRRADFGFEDDGRVVICLEDSVVAQKKAGDIIRILEKVFNERCGMGASFSVTYKEIQGKRDTTDVYAESIEASAVIDGTQGGSPSVTVRPQNARLIGAVC